MDRRRPTTPVARRSNSQASAVHDRRQWLVDRGAPERAIRRVKRQSGSLASLAPAPSFRTAGDLATRASAYLRERGPSALCGWLGQLRSAWFRTRESDIASHLRSRPAPVEHP